MIGQFDDRRNSGIGVTGVGVGVGPTGATANVSAARAVDAAGAADTRAVSARAVEAKGVSAAPPHVASTGTTASDARKSESRMGDQPVVETVAMVITDPRSIEATHSEPRTVATGSPRDHAIPATIPPGRRPMDPALDGGADPTAPANGRNPRGAAAHGIAGSALRVGGDSDSDGLDGGGWSLHAATDARHANAHCDGTPTGPGGVHARGYVNEHGTPAPPYQHTRRSMRNTVKPSA